ncbi:hypothetical protein QM467_17005, partial [Rhodoblastus sp. 17X3]|nr:hypothetical protein [Rhodoblastus sp. 17X3]
MAENVAGSKLSLFGRRNINIAFVLFVLIYFVPFLFAKIPPLGDLPGHMGRYAVQVNIDSSPLLRENWAFHWGLIANLGFDI